MRWEGDIFSSLYYVGFVVIVVAGDGTLDRQHVPTIISFLVLKEVVFTSALEMKSLSKVCWTKREGPAGGQ